MQNTRIFETKFIETNETRALSGTLPLQNFTIFTPNQQPTRYKLIAEMVYVKFRTRTKITEISYC